MIMRDGLRGLHSRALASDMEIDVTYQGVEDRICLSLRGKEGSTHWWFTRRMALGLLKGWLDKLDEVPIPTWEHAPWQTSARQRDLAQEHALSLEFDGPALNKRADLPDKDRRLVETVTITVSPTATKLNLVAGGENCHLELTRKESHAMVEALALHVRRAAWLQAIALPEWLGTVPPA